MQKIIAGLLLLGTLRAGATELVYTPINPAFGGNPANGSYLLSNAQAQDKFKDPSAVTPSSQGQTSALQQFNETLQRAILSRITSAVSASVVNASGQLVPGTIQTTDFIITIADLGGGVMQITTTDKVTGQSTSFQIGP